MKLLFVCMGNICRSPAAENVMGHLIRAQELEARFQVDSAGTIDFHSGSAPDPRMVSAAKTRGVEMTGKARMVQVKDLHRFDLILAMDRSNLMFLEDLAKKYPPERAEIKMFCDFLTEHPHEEVPDPYYGGQGGFDLVLDLLEDGCREILKQWKAGNLAP